MFTINDLVPGTSTVSAREYMAALRFQNGNLPFKYGKPDRYFANNFGSRLLLAEVPKTITDGFGRVWQVRSVLIMQMNVRTDAIDAITELGHTLPTNLQLYKRSE